ncbi:MAG: hypothetical protein H7A37_03410 [Chlamydiales bacterium]|nr:hypothetical protein [Chlamydiia bacterium]MCP5507335.1 hypothetical protein [Chlamydiales bacterium]
MLRSLSPLVDSAEIQQRRGFATEVKQTEEMSRVVITKDQLRYSYQKLLGRLTELTGRIAIAVFGTPAASGFWCLATEQTLFQSPVAIAATILGTWVASDATMQILKTRNFIQLGVKCDQQGPSKDSAINDIIKKILKGGAPLIRINAQQMIVSGPSQTNMDSIPSKETLKKIQCLEPLKLPKIVLSERTEKHSRLIFDRWMTRISVPFSILNIMNILTRSIDPDERPLRADDYVVLASSLENMRHFATNSSLSEEVKKFEDYLNAAHTAEEVVKQLVNKEFLDGPFSFLKYWSQDLQQVSVRIDRLGNLGLYRIRNSSYGGPMPISQFPNRTASLPHYKKSKLRTGNK